MLLNLHVKNVALIREIDISFKEGLNVITGETGAGKSLLLGAVNLAPGGNFSKDMLRCESDSALIELIFSIDDEHTQEQLCEMGYPPEDGELIITRKISEGRAYAKINGESTPASVLKKIANLLINIHGQRENQTLLKAERQLRLLDTYGGIKLKGAAEAVHAAYGNYKAAKKELEEYTLDENKRLREISMLEHEINEINEAALRDGEEEELERQYRLISNSKRIIEALSEVYKFTGYDSGAGDYISRAIRSIGDVSQLDDEIGEIETALNDAEAVLNDINRQTSAYLDEFSFSESEFNDIASRLNEIRRIQQKYGATTDKINEYLRISRERLEFLQNYEEEKIKAEKNYKKSTDELEAACGALSKKRRSLAKILSDELSAQLIELNFNQAIIEIEFKRAVAYRDDGYDDIEIMISTNPGEAVKPLAKIASGGELSRIMLALKNIIAEEENTGTLIFDEIDTGISGRTAQLVSEKMAAIAGAHQILCVTHLAQIAAMADAHFVIEKQADENETVTTLRRLSKDAEVGELARILGGSKISDAVRANAAEMKALAEEYKSGVRK